MKTNRSFLLSVCALGMTASILGTEGAARAGLPLLSCRNTGRVVGAYISKVPGGVAAEVSDNFQRAHLSCHWVRGNIAVCEGNWAGKSDKVTFVTEPLGPDDDYPRLALLRDSLNAKQPLPLECRDPSAQPRSRRSAWPGP